MTWVNSESKIEEVVQTLEMRETRVGDLGLAEVEEARLGNPCKFTKPLSVIFVPLMTSQVMFLCAFRCASPASFNWVSPRSTEVRLVDTFQVDEPAARDASAADLEGFQVLEPTQMHEAGIGDLGVHEHERFELL